MKYCWDPDTISYPSSICNNVHVTVLLCSTCLGKEASRVNCSSVKTRPALFRAITQTSKINTWLSRKLILYILFLWQFVHVPILGIIWNYFFGNETSRIEFMRFKQTIQPNKFINCLSVHSDPPRTLEDFEYDNITVNILFDIISNMTFQGVSVSSKQTPHITDHREKLIFTDTGHYW